MSEELVLDSFALVSLFHKEAGWRRVQAALYAQEKARARALLNWINWGEFFYVVKRGSEAPRPKKHCVCWSNCPLSWSPSINPW